MTVRVLVVDDAPTVRTYHSSMLRDAGYDVAEAANGLEAVEAALAEPYDLYLVDVNMPKMDGYGCVTALRRDPATASASVVMISTEDKPVDVELAYAAGANLYLVKPVAPARLVRMAGLLTAAPEAVESGADR